MIISIETSLSSIIRFRMKRLRNLFLMLFCQSRDSDVTGFSTIEEQFSYMVHRYGPLINRICFTYSDTTEDMKDLRQDVLINLWKGLASFKAKSSEITWIYRVALNTCVSTVRKKKKRIATSSFDSIMLDFPDESSDDDYKERTEQLHKMISILSPLEKAIITMWLDERSYQEIAEVCGLNRNTVAVKINRIKNKLKNNYEF